MKKLQKLLLILFISLIILTNSTVIARINNSISNETNLSASDIITAINNYRAQNGLPALQMNSLLTTLAQNQSNYQASISSITHTGPGGTTPQDRAASAGYGNGHSFYLSEIIYGGMMATADSALAWWKNSSLHNSIMLNSRYVEIGAGEATDGESTYITAVLGAVTDYAFPTDAYNPTNDTTSPANTLVIVAAPVIKATPMPDGSIIHIVLSGQGLWTIAAVYEVELQTLYALNDLNEYSFIYPGDHILIKPPISANLPPQASSTDSQTAPALSTPTNRILGSAISIKGEQFMATSTENTAPTPTSLSTEYEQKKPSGAEPAHIFIILALISLFAVIIGSIFIQKPQAQPPDSND